MKHVTEEAFESYGEAMAERFDCAETYDFMRCVRKDGSHYGTAGQCRIGARTDAAPEKKSSGTRTRPKAAIEADMKKLSSSGAMNAKGKAGIDARAKHAALKAELKKPLAGGNKDKAQNTSRAQKDAVAPAPPKSAMTKKDPVANVQKQQRENAALKKSMDKDVTALAKAGKIKGISPDDVKRIQDRKATLETEKKVQARVKELDKQAKAANKEADRLDKEWRKGGGKDKELGKRVREADKRAKQLDREANKADAAWRKM